SVGEYAPMLSAEGLLGHQHANSGWGTFDDDNMVGATAFMETLELALELRPAGYGAHGESMGAATAFMETLERALELRRGGSGENGERLGFDLYPYTEDAVEAV